MLREVLSFGLPRVPHGVAHQVIAVADRYILTKFVSLREIGLYSVGASFGLGMKLFLSAFENAWAPFYFETMKEPDAKRTFSHRHDLQHGGAGAARGGAVGLVHRRRAPDDEAGLLRSRAA